MDLAPRFTIDRGQSPLLRGFNLAQRSVGARSEGERMWHLASPSIAVGARSYIEIKN
jgi:hypothetical protein